MTRSRRIPPSVLAFLAFALAAPVGAVDFPPVGEEERALESMPRWPEAPAVVVYERGRFTMMGALASESYSSLVVEGRIKLLTEEGRDHGEVTIHHSDFVRLVALEGRTVLPDGREVPLSEEHLFRETVTGDKKWYQTTATFPAVEPGAILDYRYELRFEVVTTLDPWYFQDVIPTLHSEITYYVPGHVSAQPWGKATFGRQFQSSQQRTARGTEVKVWMDDLPAVPHEPESLPFEDLSSSFLLLPTLIEDGGTRFLLFEDWKSACDVIDYSYREMRRRDGRTRSRAKELAREAGRDPEARARAVFAFVRDEIATVDLPGVTPKMGESLDELLRERRADLAGKGLMLEAMLDAAGLDPELVWAADRRFGIIDPSLANPNWFETVLVRLELGGREVFLDPGSPAHAFGYLRPNLEGMDAVVYSRRDPRVIPLPTAPHEANARRASLELAVDAEGRLTGSGSLVFEGHHGARWFRREPTAAGRREALTDSLEEDFPGFEVSEVEVEGDLEASRVSATWTLAQREEEVLGDQAALVPSRPLGPVAQRFTLAPVERATPVLLPFADRDVVELSVTWPEGWVAEVLPEAVAFESAAGSFATEIERDPETRRLRVRRTFDTVEREHAGWDAYLALRKLYATASESDARELVLVRP